jgi:EmrB/QacA subfamily drug resistance transporter
MADRSGGRMFPPVTKEETRLSSAAGRWILAASVLGSGAVFLEGSVVAVAVPAIGRDLGLGIAGLQWVMNGFLLTLSALMLFGGALGDRGSRAHVFGVGLVGFTVSSVGCALAPNIAVLVVARLIQGTAGALVVPNSLALLETTFRGEARGVAIGRWAAWSSVSTALGPLVGGWLVDIGSWRLVFYSVVPFALAAAWIAFRHAGAVEKSGKRQVPSLDYAGAVLATLGLGGIVGALIAGPESGFTSIPVMIGLVGGTVLLGGFLAVENRAAAPLLPLDVFRTREFVGANLNTLLVYAALSGLFFLLMLQLQNGLGYSALGAGASLLPVNVLMLVLSPWSGHLAERIGPRVPMAVGSLIAGAGMLLFIRVQPGAAYLGAVMPALLVFGIGLGLLVAPLTTAALRSLGEQRAGIASGVNNAVARLAGLLATAAIPAAAGLGGAHQLKGATLSAGFSRAMVICAVLCGVGGLVAATTIRSGPGRRQRSDKL